VVAAFSPRALTRNTLPLGTVPLNATLPSRAKIVASAFAAVGSTGELTFEALHSTSYHAHWDWSPDGSRLAQQDGDSLRVRSDRGETLVSAALPFVAEGMVWGHDGIYLLEPHSGAQPGQRVS